MSLELTAENMNLFFPSWLKPLENQEIIDFLNTPIKTETRLWWPEWHRDLPRRPVNNLKQKQYTTKSAIKQEIKLINDQLELWLSHKQSAPNEITKEFAEAHLEDLFTEKEKLQARLSYTGVKFNNNNLEMAKQVPLSNFLKFNRAGFTNCIWHDERTPSLHKLPGKERVYCFCFRLLTGLRRKIFV